MFFIHVIHLDISSFNVFNDNVVRFQWSLIVVKQMISPT